MAGNRGIKQREKVKARYPRKKEEELEERQKRGNRGTVGPWDLIHVAKIPLPAPPAPHRQ